MPEELIQGDLFEEGGPLPVENPQPGDPSQVIDKNPARQVTSNVTPDTKNLWLGTQEEDDDLPTLADLSKEWDKEGEEEERQKALAATQPTEPTKPKAPSSKTEGAGSPWAVMFGGVKDQAASAKPDKPGSGSEGGSSRFSLGGIFSRGRNENPQKSAETTQPQAQTTDSARQDALRAQLDQNAKEGDDRINAIAYIGEQSGRMNFFGMSTNQEDPSDFDFKKFVAANPSAELQSKLTKATTDEERQAVIDEEVNYLLDYEYPRMWLESGLSDDQSLIRTFLGHLPYYGNENDPRMRVIKKWYESIGGS